MQKWWIRHNDWCSFLLSWYSSFWSVTQCNWCFGPKIDNILKISNFKGGFEMKIAAAIIQLQLLLTLPNSKLILWDMEMQIWWLEQAMKTKLTLIHKKIRKVKLIRDRVVQQFHKLSMIYIKALLYGKTNSRV
jgi:hypothetical protein